MLYPMRNASVPDIAREALEILDRDGWNKGSLTRLSDEGVPPAWLAYKTGSHCIAGAWNLAQHGHEGWDLNGVNYFPLYDMIKAQWPEYRSVNAERYAEMLLVVPGLRISSFIACFIADWNNAVETTETDVRTILEKLAAG